MSSKAFLKQYTPTTYGAQWALDYDELDIASSEYTAATVTALAKEANGGPVLLAAAATGRVAIPLAESGVTVTATDASPEMVERLKAKDAKQLVRTKIETLPHISTTEQYAVITILANSIWVLQTAEDQLAVLTNARRQLRPGGVVVIEMGIVDTSRWTKPNISERCGKTITRTSRWNTETQQLHHRFVLESGKNTSLRDVYLRYMTHDELVNTATRAGLRPKHLWSDWNGTLFDDQSQVLIAFFEADTDEC
jgi:2-polyprenyl-3-methyl-5-hydroxy-6-metoxy-1,4-benzoquinol methylase